MGFSERVSFHHITIPCPPAGPEPNMVQGRQALLKGELPLPLTKGRLGGILKG